MGWVMWILTMVATFFVYRWMFALIKQDEEDRFDVPLWFILVFGSTFLIPYLNVVCGIIFIIVMMKEVDYFNKDMSEFVKKIFFLKD